jgi:hypothetical protein
MAQRGMRFLTLARGSDWLVRGRVRGETSGAKAFFFERWPGGTAEAVP